MLARTVKDGVSAYTQINLERLTTAKTASALCAVGSDQIVVSGGFENNIVYNKVFRLRLTPLPQTASWEELPALNVARRDHASCALGSSVFVFCGTAGDCRMSLNSIERLSLQREQRMTYWQLIRAPVATLEPRCQPAVAPLNAHEIAILGGWSKEGFSRLGDVVIFDSRTCKVTKVVASANEGTPKFNATANQSGRT